MKKKTTSNRSIKLSSASMKKVGFVSQEESDSNQSTQSFAMVNEKINTGA